MTRYTATLFDILNQWYYEATIEAESLDAARKIALRDHADRTTKLKRITQS